LHEKGGLQARKFFYGVLFRFIQMRQIRRKKVSNAARANVLFEMLWRAIANPEAGAYPQKI